MTERLSQLLREEASDLVPPAPDAAAVLGRGRRLRTRQRATTGAAVVGVAAVLVTTAGFVALNAGEPGAREPQVATQADTPDVVAYGVGSQVVVGDAVAEVPDSVHSLHYTSAGVLVRSNPNDGASDGSGPESLTLVTYEGETVDLGTIPEGVGPATDPARDVYVLAEAAGDGFEAVVRDATTGEVEQRVALPDLPPSYWEVPPLALDGDTLYVGYKRETVAVDLATGENRVVDGLGGGIPAVHDGRAVVQKADALQVVEVASGDVVGTVSADPDTYPWGTLSPDGRFLSVVDQMSSQAQVAVHDLQSGTEHTFSGSDWGWTAGGRWFRLGGDVLTSCDAATGSCEESTAPVEVPGNAMPRLAGRVYES